MDTYNYNNTDNSNNSWQREPYTQPEKKPMRVGDGISSAAMIFAGLALISVPTGIFPLIFGSLSIIFVVLSKRRDYSLPSSARTGMWISIIAMVIGIFLTISAFKTLYENPDLLKIYTQIVSPAINPVPTPSGTTGGGLSL